MNTMQLSPASITLYSINPEKHDAITQNKGSWKNTIHGLRLFKEFGIPFIVSVPITKINIDDFEKLFDFCEKELGAVSIGPNPFISFTVNHEKTNTRVVPDLNDIKIFAQRYFIYENQNNANILPIKKVKDDDYQIYGKGFYGSLTVLPNGNLVAGTLLPDLVLGNVNKDDVLDVWKNSPLLNKWRRFKISDLDLCKDCEVRDWCEPSIGDNWVANHDLLKCDRHYCDMNKIYYKTLLQLQANKN